MPSYTNVKLWFTNAKGRSCSFSLDTIYDSYTNRRMRYLVIAPVPTNGNMHRGYFVQLSSQKPTFIPSHKTWTIRDGYYFDLFTRRSESPVFTLTWMQPEDWDDLSPDQQMNIIAKLPTSGGSSKVIVTSQIPFDQRLLDKHLTKVVDLWSLILDNEDYYFNEKVISEQPTEEIEPEFFNPKSTFLQGEHVFCILNNLWGVVSFCDKKFIHVTFKTADGSKSTVKFTTFGSIADDTLPAQVIFHHNASQVNVKDVEHTFQWLLSYTPKKGHDNILTAPGAVRYSVSPFYVATKEQAINGWPVAANVQATPMWQTRRINVKAD
jgi:hypothetical protein